MANWIAEHTMRVWDPTSQERVTVRIQVVADSAEIARSLADKAFRNKSKRAKEVGGCVIVSVL